MTSPRSGSHDPAHDDAGVIVVGSGPTGATVAATLVERGVPVTMLESGERVDRGVVVRAAGNTLARWTSTRQLSTTRHAQTEIEWYAARGAGGLTSYWTGSVPRFTDADFSEGARLDERYAWPIALDDLIDDYDWVERKFRVTAGDPISSLPAPTITHRTRVAPKWAAVADRLDEIRTPGGPALGAMPMAKGEPWMIALRATEFNAYTAIVDPLRDRRQFELRLGQHVTHLERSPGSDRYDTVVSVDRATSSVTKWRGQAIVLCAGAVDTTALLLRSRDDDHPDGLGNAQDVLGRYLHDHPRQWWRVGLDRPMPALAHPLYLTRDDPDTSEPLTGAGFTLGLAQRSDRIRSWFRGSVDSIGVLTFGMTVPTPDDRILLDHGSDAGPDESDVRFDYRFDAAIEPSIDRSRSRFLELLAAGGITATEEFRLPLGAPGSSVHLGGTARMHRDPRFGVLDERNRIHGVPEVLVCDSACFTTGPEKNPAPTAMAIARRAARLLATDVG